MSLKEVTTIEKYAKMMRALAISLSNDPQKRQNCKVISENQNSCECELCKANALADEAERELNELRDQLLPEIWIG